MWLSRVLVNRDGGLESLGPILLPDDDSERVSTGHRMIWSLFPGMGSDRKEDRGRANADRRPRDHLWREETRGRYIVLSREQPATTPLLRVLEVKAFEPQLSAGDTLRFRLRVNPTITTKRAGVSERNPRRGKRTDVIMDAVYSHDHGGRAHPRNEQLGWGEDTDGNPLPLLAPRRWLDRQGSGSGFEVIEAVALAYQTLRVPRRSRASGSWDSAQIGVVDLDGVIRLSDPVLFIGRLITGFGSAKAFGNGLMLIRRA